MPTAIFLSGWSGYGQEDQGISREQADELAGIIQRSMQAEHQHFLDLDNIRAGRVSNTRITVRVAGGREACWQAANEVRKAVQRGDITVNNQTIKCSVEDDPERRQTRAEVGRILRTLELELPAGTPIKPDWPDKVYGGRNTRLLARVLRSRTVQWQMAPINEIAPNLTKGRLDETLAAQ